MEYDNDIIIENDIVKAISFNEGVYVTKPVLVDAENLFGNRSSKKTNFKIKTEAQETHELCWQNYLVKVIKSSNVSVPEIIQLTKLQR